MGGRGLLSRIAGAGPIDELDSVLAHLRVLLNARVGEAPTVPRLGVIGFQEVAHSSQGGIQALAASMRACIQEFEPRLKSVVVRHLPRDGGLQLRFEISAQRAGPGGRPLRLTTTVQPGGRVDVTG